VGFLKLKMHQTPFCGRGSALQGTLLGELYDAPQTP